MSYIKEFLYNRESEDDVARLEDELDVHDLEDEVAHKVQPTINTKVPETSRC